MQVVGVIAVCHQQMAEGARVQAHIVQPSADVVASIDLE